MKVKKLRKLIKGYGKGAEVLIENYDDDVIAPHEHNFQLAIFNSAEDLVESIDIGTNF